jgi:hypothetical protein
MWLLRRVKTKRLNIQSAGPVCLLIICSISIFLLESLLTGRRPQCSDGAVQQGMYSTPHSSPGCFSKYLSQSEKIYKTPQNNNINFCNENIYVEHIRLNKIPHLAF